MRIGIFSFALVIQFLLLAYSFPLEELLTPTPILFSDAGYHWYHMKLAVALARDGTQWAYHPFFAAGHPRGVFLDSSANFPAALAALFAPAVSVEVLYKIHAFVSGLIAPVSVLAAAYLLGLSRRQAIAAFVLGLLLFWTSMFRWYYTSGMVSFVTASYLALPFVALFIRYTSGGGGHWALVGTGAFGALAFFYHPFFPVIVAVTIGCWLILSYRDISIRRALAAITVIPLISVLPNLAWLDALRSYGMPGVLSAYQVDVDATKIWKEFLGIWQGRIAGSKAYAPIAILALWAAVRGEDRRSREIVIAFCWRDASLLCSRPSAPRWKCSDPCSPIVLHR